MDNEEIKADKKIKDDIEVKNKKNKFMNSIKELFIYFLIIVGVILIRNYIVTPVRVDGDSMNDNLKNGEILLLKKYDKNFERFDIVVFDYGKDKLIKRIIGLPGEHIAYKNNKLYVNGEYVEENMINKKTYDFDIKEHGYNVIPDGYYFVLGDNRTSSADSRIIGLISKDDILGTTNFAVFPFTKFGRVNK